jgi:hypothetical protein
VRLGLWKGTWAAMLGQSWKGKRDGERKAGWLREIGPEELREYRKGFRIFKI